MATLGTWPDGVGVVHRARTDLLDASQATTTLPTPEPIGDTLLSPPALGKQSVALDKPRGPASGLLGPPRRSLLSLSNLAGAGRELG
jgi:hypothetical protein